MGAPLEKGPRAAAGALLLNRAKRFAFSPGAKPRVPEWTGMDPLRSEPVEARFADARDLFFVEQADASPDHAEHAVGEEGPGFGVRVAVGVEDAFRLPAADQVGHEVVHLAHVAAEVPAELGVLARLPEGLHPELRHLELAVADPDLAVADCLECVAHVVGRGERPLPGGADIAPHVIERREIEVALRGEVAIEDRLRDPRRARDLGRRRTAIAALGEDPDRSLDQCLAALGRRQPCRRDGHAASNSLTTASGWCRACRSVAAAIRAPANAITAPTSIAWWNPFTNATGRA